MDILQDDHEQLTEELEHMEFDILGDLWEEYDDNVGDRPITTEMIEVLQKHPYMNVDFKKEKKLFDKAHVVPTVHQLISMDAIISKLRFHLMYNARIEAVKQENPALITYDENGKPLYIEYNFQTKLQPKDLYNFVKNDCFTLRLAKTIKFKEILDEVFAANKIKKFVKKYSQKRRKEAEDCSICFNKLSKGGECRTLQCGHSFHYDCIQNQTKCPLCREKIKKSVKCRVYKSFSKQT